MPTGHYRFRRSLGNVGSLFRGARPDTYPLFSGLLDQYVGAAAAYSLRTLAASWLKKDVVEVRRASDNTSEGFTEKEITDGTLVDWVNEEIELPLDTASGAAAAYSLRNLSASYTGNVVDVRRSSDDAENSFTAAEVADGTLTDWVTEEQVGWNVQPTWDVNAGDAIISSQSSTATTSTVSFTTTSGTSSIRQNSKPNHIVASSGDTVEINLDISGLDSNMRIRLSPSGSNVDVKTFSNISNGSNQTLSGTLTGDAGNVRFIDLAATSGATITINSIKVIGQSGFVTQWYDQSGNNNHATQGTDASQPKIVDAGSLVSGGLDFDGVDDGLATSGQVLTSSSFYAASVMQHATGTSIPAGQNVFGQYQVNTPGRFQLSANNLNQYSFFANAADSISGFAVGAFGTSRTLISVNGDGSNAEIWRDGTSKATDTYSGFTPANVNFTIGIDASGDREFNGKIAEVIIYPSDQSANRVAIESNIASHYSITLPTGSNPGSVDGFVSTWYDQSGNANDAVQATATSQPKIVDAGVLVSGGIDFDGADDFLLAPDGAVGIDSSFILSQSDSSAVQAVAGTNTVFNYYGLIVNANTFRFGQTGSLLDATVTSTSNEFLSTLLQSDGNVYLNGSLSASGTVNVDGDDLTIGARQAGSSAFWSGVITESIFYPSDQSANRVGIETNINNQYEIYQVFPITLP